MRNHWILPFIFLSISLIGQSPVMQSLSVKEGLSQGLVHSIAEDSRGFIWIGTAFGLNRYDGYEIKQYPSSANESNGQYGHAIFSITEDTRQLLWLNTDAGIFIFDPYSQQFAALTNWMPELSGVVIKYLYADKNGHIWLIKKGEENAIYRLEMTENMTAYFRKQGKAQVLIKSSKVDFPASFGKRFGTVVDEDGNRLVCINVAGEAYDINKKYNRIVLSPYVSVRMLHPRISVFTSQTLKVEWLHFHNPDASNEELRYRLFKVLTDQKGRKHIIRPGNTESYLMDETVLKTYPLPFNQRNIVDKLPIFERADQPLSETGIIDRSGNLWLGTLGYGVRIFSEKKIDFEVLHPKYSFLNMCGLNNNQLWSGRIRPSIFLSLKNGYPVKPDWESNIYPSENLLFFREGANKQLFCTVWDRSMNMFRFLQIDLVKNSRIQLKQQVGSFERENAYIGFVDKETVCFSQPEGILSFYNVTSGIWQTESLSEMTQNANNTLCKITFMTETNLGRLWIGSNTGIFELYKFANKIRKNKYTFTTQANHSENNPEVLCLTPSYDNPGVLWVGTKGAGLYRLIPNINKFELYTKSTQTNNLVMYGIIADEAGNLWFSTNNGISRLQINTGAMVNYNSIYPELKREYNSGAAMAIGKDAFLFGSVEGLVRINPTLLLRTVPPAKVEWTDIIVDEENKEEKSPQRIAFDEKGVPTIQLPPGEQTIKISFSACGSDQPKLLSYRYKVIGLHTDWITLGNQNSILIGSLTPGRYELQIQSMNGQLTSKKISSIFITKKWPWYRTYFAWTSYIIILVFLIIRWRKQKEQKLLDSYKINLQDQEIKRILELDKYRKSFFSYIVHEFKTPLSIIAGLSRKLNHKQDHISQQNIAQSIDYQTNVMLELIDQMMDITKLEEGTVHLHLQFGDLNDYLEQIVNRFQPAAQYKQIELTYYSSTQELVTEFDPTRTKHMLTNLISNAIRYTQIGGQVTVTLSELPGNMIRLVVKDNGAGISSAFLPNIFNKYAQNPEEKAGNHTFGLGLAYVKELVELHEGTIHVNSFVGKGSTFTIEMPLRRGITEMQNALQIDQPINPSRILVNQDISKPLLLLVEDNAAMGAFLLSHLTEDYQMLVANNGEEGLHLAVNEIPDLIITDVMMPVMNGIEMSEMCRNHALTSHIPIIMLSAKSEISDKLAGYEAGVDIYLSKPVNTDELMFSIRNLLARQKKLKKFDRHGNRGNNTEETVLPFDERVIRSTNAFLDSIYAIFESHYQKDDFDMPFLYKNLNMSKSQFHRKLKVISALSANELLVQFRLDKSIELLKSHDTLSLKEIAYQVGFKDPAYFSRIFTKKFGISPSKYKEKEM